MPAKLASIAVATASADEVAKLEEVRRQLGKGDQPDDDENAGGPAWARNNAKGIDGGQGRHGSPPAAEDSASRESGVPPQGAPGGAARAASNSWCQLAGCAVGLLRTGVVVYILPKRWRRPLTEVTAVYAASCLGRRAIKRDVINVLFFVLLAGRWIPT